jgi:hypothetical protein
MIFRFSAYDAKVFNMLFAKIYKEVDQANSSMNHGKKAVSGGRWFNGRLYIIYCFDLD